MFNLKDLQPYKNGILCLIKAPNGCGELIFINQVLNLKLGLTNDSMTFITKNMMAGYLQMGGSEGNKIF